jgi:hypothetical protein
MCTPSATTAFCIIASKVVVPDGVLIVYQYSDTKVMHFSQFIKN